MYAVSGHMQTTLAKIVWFRLTATLTGLETQQLGNVYNLQVNHN